MEIADDNGRRVYWTMGPITDGKWRHIAVAMDRLDSAKSGIYVDGAPVQIHRVLDGRWQGAQWSALSPAGFYTKFDPTPVAGALGRNNPLVVGYDGIGRASRSPFDIDEIEDFDRALTAAEVATLARQPKSR